MSDLSISRRYAHALYDLAEKDGTVGKIDTDADLVLQTVEQSRQLRLLLDSPIVATEKKQAVMAKIFDSRISSGMSTFLSFMIEKGRDPMLAAALTAYKALRDEQEGVVRAIVVSAHAITQDEVKSVKDSLERISGKKVEMSFRVEEELIGGVVVRLGDVVYDGSIRQKLDSLKEKMARGTFSGVN